MSGLSGIFTFRLQSLLQSLFRTDENYIFFWLIALVAFLIIEIITLGLTTIWFAAGALISFIAAWLGQPLGVQLVLFFIVSFILLIFTRPWAMKYLNGRTTKTNAESLVGEIGIVTVAINNLKATGQVQVKGSYWTARSREHQEEIPEGSTVRIEEIKGVKCIVTPIKE